MTDRQRGRILLVAINFAPELTGIGKYVGEMTEDLARAGLDLRVVTAPPYYPQWRVAEGYTAVRYTRERLAGALVYRCPIYVPRQPRGLNRALHLLSFALSSLPVVLWQAAFWRPQVVFAVEPPLGSVPGAWLAARLARAHAWLHVQDFEIDAAFDLGMLRQAWLRGAALGVERWLMRRFDRVSSISERMLARLRCKGVDPARIGIFPNWVETDRIRPLSGENRLRAELGIAAQTRVLLYSGNMGEKQGLEVIVEVAQGFRFDPAVLFLLCGSGAARPRIQASAEGLPNVRLLPLQPLERLNELLNLADVHLLPQRADAEDLVMPSKLTAIMASGRPVVASARPGSDVERAASRGGLVVAPGDAAGFAAAVRRLLGDAELRARLGAAGREYARAHWERRVVLQRFHEELCAWIAQK